MSKVIPKEQLTAYQRWELAAFDEGEVPPELPTRHVPPPPQVIEPPPEPPEPQVVLPTAEEIEALHQEAWQEGYQIGVEEGRKDGYAAGHQAAEHYVNQLKTLVNALEGGLIKQDQEVAHEVLELSLVMARQILRSALHIKPELILEAIQEALKTLPTLNGHHKIITHPDSAQVVRDWLAQEHSHISWKVMEDLKMEPGDFRFESAYSELDGTLQSRWEELTRCLGTDSRWLN
jgi:flagellar assembly protein FliH